MAITKSVIITKKAGTSKFMSQIPSQRWVHFRQNYLGGSEVAAALGKSDWQTPLQLWRIKKGLQEPPGSTPVTEFGNVFEPVMAEKFSQITGFKTRNISRSFTYSKHPFLRAHIDRQIVSNQKHKTAGLPELKTTTSYRLKNLSGPFPLEWKYQIQFYLCLTGYDYAYLFIYERDTAEYHQPVLIFRDERFIDEMIQAAVTWWKRHIDDGVRPNPINAEDRLILFPKSKAGNVVEATPKAYGYYTELLDIRNRLERLKTLEERHSNLLKDQIKGSERLVLGGRNLVTWKNTVSNRMDVTKFKMDHPELYSKYCVESQTRRFQICKIQINRRNYAYNHKRRPQQLSTSPGRTASSRMRGCSGSG